MNNKFIELLKTKNYVIPSYLFSNYRSLNISDRELIILIYLINNEQPIVCDYNKISKDMNIEKKDIMLNINELKNKGFLELKLQKNEKDKLEEYIFLESLFSKIFINIIDEKEEENNSVYSIFEKELGRMLSPIEYELIGGWINIGYKEEIIIEALKEAVFSGVSSFRYIDKILLEWNKKGIDSLEKVSKSKKEYISKEKDKIEIPDYDWLNDEK